MSVNSLFNKNYVLLTSEKLTDFVVWVEKLNIDFEENGIEILESIYAVYISRLENKGQNLPIEQWFPNGGPRPHLGPQDYLHGTI